MKPPSSFSYWITGVLVLPHIFLLGRLCTYNLFGKIPETSRGAAFIAILLAVLVSTFEVHRIYGLPGLMSVAETLIEFLRWVIITCLCLSPILILFKKPRKTHRKSM